MLYYMYVDIHHDQFVAGILMKDSMKVQLQLRVLASWEKVYSFFPNLKILSYFLVFTLFNWAFFFCVEISHSALQFYFDL